MRLFLFSIVLILLCAASGICQKTDAIRRVNFERVKYPVEDDLSQKDLSVEKTVFGDLDGDRREEAAVIVRWSLARYGGNGFGYYLYVYRLQKGKLSLLAKMNGGSKSEHFMLKDIAIENARLAVRRCEADKNFDKFSLATIFFELRGDKLFETDKTSQPVEEQCYIG